MIIRKNWTIDWGLLNEAEVEGIEVIPNIFFNIASRAILDEQKLTFAGCLGLRWLIGSAYILFVKKQSDDIPGFI